MPAANSRDSNCVMLKGLLTQLFTKIRFRIVRYFSTENVVEKGEGVCWQERGEMMHINIAMVVLFTLFREFGSFYYTGGVTV